jgi:DNA-binding transcriptional MerR regulator
MREFSIGELARVTGVKVPTIRYYEDIGLMAEAPRTGGGQRRYSSHARDRLGFIAHARDMGFALEAIRSLIDLSEHPERPCDGADQIALQRLDDVNRRIERLTRLKHELERMLAGHCSGAAADCRIIEVLGDHAKCETDH